MNQDNKRGRNFLDRNLNLSSETPHLKDKSNGDVKEKNKKGVGVLKMKSKSKITMGPGAAYDQCFSGSNFASQYEDECPVNYSLKYSETESCKSANKCETAKKKFKDYADYSETDLDQPTDFSLKYAEKTYEDENKSPTFNYFNSHKVKFKEYTDYVETDLDQPTDFTLKYRESVEEDVKNLDFNYYENEERKASSGFGTRRIQGEEAEDAPCERLPERFTSQNETPLMFSRSSSMNSLSSFVHITQSIPDDRSSVVSDFSRMTSGIISPSELPDSPTQTAPSSPKRHKPSSVFSAKPDFLSKQSVFEDDVATYKQEDTPIEFSRATSLSSLNIENPVKSELVIKRNSTPLTVSKEENQNPVDYVQSEYLKHQIVPEKMEHEKGKFELASVLEVDESLCGDCISIDIQINCRKPKPNFGRLVENNVQLRQSNGFPAKPSLRLRFHSDSRKGYSTFEGSDDAVHTYHTEGTPANVSHAGSHSDLSALSISSGIPLSGVDGNSDSESFFSEVPETAPVVKAEILKNSAKAFHGSEPVKMKMNGDGNFPNSQTQLDYLRKDHQLTAKDETATFATENSPCDFSIRSSLSDLTVNVIDPPLSISRVSGCEEPPSQMLSPLRNVSPQSPSSIVFDGEDGDGEKCSEEPQNEFVSEVVNKDTDDWNHSNEEEEEGEQKAEGSSNGGCARTEANFEFDSNQPLTPFEEALLEECIRLGMPPKKSQKPLQETEFGEEKPEKNHSQEFSFSKFEDSKYLNEKKAPSSASDCEVPPPRQGKDASNVLNGDNFDFDTSEPLTPFEEVLLEQCIRLGMPQKKNSRRESLENTSAKYLNAETENFDCDSTELITPLETALLEQCIRLGMPQKKGQKKGEGNDESHKGIMCLSAHLNKLKLNSENEKEKDALKKCDGCSCGKKHNNRRKSTNCKKSKNRVDQFKVESCPG